MEDAGNAVAEHVSQFLQGVLVCHSAGIDDDGEYAFALQSGFLQCDECCLKAEKKGVETKDATLHVMAFLVVVEQFPQFPLVIGVE